MDPLTRQVLSTTGGKKSLPYVDTVFSNYVYKGNSSTQSITTNVDMTEGGMIWMKARTTTDRHNIFDTKRGVGRPLFTNETLGEGAFDSTAVTSFNDDGWSMGADGMINATNQSYGSWTFRKSPGFFDVVKYTGTGSALTLTHELGSVPGCIIIKRIDADSYDWTVYHSAILHPYTNGYVELNDNAPAASGNNRYDQGAPTATNFSVGIAGDVNASGGEYIAYIFAGGPSTAATAKSVDFDGSGDELIPSETLIPSGQDSTQFCLETWFKLDNTTTNQVIYSQYDSSQTGRMMFVYENNKVFLWMGGNEQQLNTGDYSVYPNSWYHVAWTYDGTTHRMFLNGRLTDTLAGSSLPAGINQSNERIGKGYGLANWILFGKLSNFRVTVGQSVYISNFIPSTEPFTTTSQGVTGTNCKMLCCNSTTLTNNDGSLGTLTTGGDPTGSSDSPFDDPAGWVFGEDEDKGIIKCGSYGGTGSATDEPMISLGWQPQFVMIKNISSTEHWAMFDNMRDMVTGDGVIAAAGDDSTLYPNLNNAAATSVDYIDIIPGGFRIPHGTDMINKSGDTMIYIAIRKIDGYVGKPPEAGTDAFAMDTGNGSSTIPVFDSGFPVGMALSKSVSQTENWFLTSRVTGTGQVFPNNSLKQSVYTDMTFDSNVGWCNASAYGAGYQSWMWKEGPGFDTVSYLANGLAPATINHSLGKVPEMVWIKRRSAAAQWMIGHKGLNGGTNPWEYVLILDTNGAQVDTPIFWDTAPTSTQVYVSDHGNVNEYDNYYIMMVFASVDGISKCGYYDGGTADQTISLGFTPRFIIIKGTGAVSNWSVYDTTRGWTGSGGERLKLETDDSQSSDTLCYPTATGFQLTTTSVAMNASGQNYIYYAHA